jgi:hypothetical protein
MAGKLKRFKSPQYHSVYTNAAWFTVNFYDFSFGFGRAITPEEGDSEIEELANVTMSLEHAKALCAGMIKAIETYEGAHGPIRALKPPETTVE